MVVGGRIYALYPYLRGVPRQDADITTEVGVDHRLDSVGWHSKKIRIRAAPPSSASRRTGPSSTSS